MTRTTYVHIWVKFDANLAQIYQDKMFIHHIHAEVVTHAAISQRQRVAQITLMWECVKLNFFVTVEKLFALLFRTYGSRIDKSYISESI